MEIGTLSIIVLCIAALGTGISKGGVPGLVTVLTPFTAMVMPARVATGVLLPILILGDIVSVIYWRRKAAWNQLLKMLPWTVVGIAIGYFLMRLIDDETFKPILGCIIIFITVAGILRKKYDAKFRPENKLLAALIGIFAGLFSMLANAAAPLVTMYLLSLNLDKEDFVGTNAWFFLITNLLKLPFSFGLGIITVRHLLLDASMIPLVVGGVAVGIALLKRIPQKTFNIIVQALALVAGAKLLF